MADPMKYRRSQKRSIAFDEAGVRILILLNANLTWGARQEHPKTPKEKQ